MLFTSLEFYLSLTAVFLLWLVMPMAKRPLVLLAASYALCASWQPWFVLVLLFSTLASWGAGLWLAGSADAITRKQVLILAVFVNLLPLLFFKYFNFFNASLTTVFSTVGWTFSPPQLSLLLPIGLSFYTFQAILYCVDVYKNRIEAESDPWTLALYLAFFPRLISGPIERGAAMLPQLKRPARLDSALFVTGFQLFVWGVFKKIVIADRMSMYVAMVFGSPETMYGKTAIIGAWIYSLQIYCDFSAYMDMAIGCGRIFGIELSRNFYFPYMARSIADFWRRWHITLTSWFRDYVYIPLGGNRAKPEYRAVNVMIVFLLSGLWHGAAWTFVFWGGLHGLLYLAGWFTAPVRKRVRELLGVRGTFAALWQMFITFQLVTLAWVFFRARTVEDAFVLIRNMFINLDLPVRMLSSQMSTYLAFGFALVFVAVEFIAYWADKKGRNPVLIIPPLARYPAYAIGLLIMSLFGISSHEFIYFQF